MSRHSKRVREQAADLLAQLASQKVWNDGVYSLPGFGKPARNCAFDAIEWLLTLEAERGAGYSWRTLYADAEAALRSGVR